MFRNEPLDHSKLRHSLKKKQNIKRYKKREKIIQKRNYKHTIIRPLFSVVKEQLT